MASDVYMWILAKHPYTYTYNHYTNCMIESADWANMYLHVVNIELTFAGLHTLRPPVISVSVPTILIPSTARSTTTDSARLFKLAAL